MTSDETVFGWSVSVCGDWAIVGAPEDSTFGIVSGAAYAFQRVGSSWIQTQKLFASDAQASDQFGRAVAIDGYTAVFGAHHEDPQGVSSAGSVYVFELQGTTWVETAKLSATPAYFDAHFGWSVAIEGDRVVVGARDSWQNGIEAGAAYVFDRIGSTWTQTGELLAQDGGVFDHFGGAVDLSGDLAIVGSQSNDGPAGDQGAAYVYELNASTWEQYSKLVSSDVVDGDNFGGSVAIDQDQLLVGAASHDHAGSNAGAVYVFERQGSAWIETQELWMPDASAQDKFGGQLAIDGELALVSATNDSDGVGNLFTGYGSVYVLRRSVSQWAIIGKFTARDAAAFANDAFGHSISLWQTTVFAGSPGDDDGCPGSSCNSGSAYMFELAPDSVQYGHCIASAPCANTDFHGGCKSSIVRGGEFAAAGSSSVALDELYFHAQRLPANKSMVMFMGGGQGQAVLGDGLKVVSVGSTGIRRYPIQVSDAAGFLAFGPGLIAQVAPAITAGSIWNFQCWYRDPTGPCGHGTNLTNGVQVTFVP